MAVVDIAVNVIADVIATLTKKAASQARYLFCFNNVVETLEKKKLELITTQQSIEKRAERAHRKSEKIDDVVQKWLEDAQNLIIEVADLKAETDRHSAAGWCPNCIQRYRLGRRVAKKTEELTQHNGNCNFSEFARLATLRGMEYYSSEGFISFESRKCAYDEIMKALNIDEIRKIGVYGMGGCGKTTLVKEVGKEVEKRGLFEKVLFVVVSTPPDIGNIQANIAGSIDVEFKSEKNAPERAKRLSMSLNNMGKILVILDDVWEKLHLEDIGIPNNCYILLTTRNSSVCSTMECQQPISLSLLNPTESWSLFLNHAGISDDKFDTFKDVAREIAEGCNGLPVAIAALASSLKDKELVDWELARDKLRDSELVDIEPGLQNPYKCLRVSYDNLIREEVKSLFLLCSLFPEDYEIPVEDLTRLAMGLGLFGKACSNDRTRKEVGAAINKLINSCLLLKGDARDDTIKMHDLVNDVALYIAKTENKIIRRVRSKKELEELSILQDSQIRYLYCDIDGFIDQLNCPKLECLLINIDPENLVQVVPDEFFNGMEELRVLGLINKGLKSESRWLEPELPFLHLSESINSLKNLCCLMLIKWKLGDISFVNRLTAIEALILQYCSFNEIPDEIANLKNLRLLDLLVCEIEKNPCGVIERCSQLVELYFLKNKFPPYLGDNKENSVELFGKDSAALEFKLQRYHIEIGSGFNSFKHLDYSIRRYLSMQYFDSYSLSTTIVDFIRRVEALSLGGIHGGCKSIIPDFVKRIGEGMNELTKLIVHDSREVECVVDMANPFNQIGTVFSNLTYLEISWMKHLESLFLGQPPDGLFQKLEELHIHNCIQLKRMIENEVEEIISDGDNPSSCNPVFPKLKMIFIKNCEQLEYLMPVSFAKHLLSLENVEIKNAPRLKYVFGQSNHDVDDLLCNQNLNELHVIKLPSLKSIKFYRVENIISIFPGNYYPICPSLDSLELRRCSNLNIMLGDLKFGKMDHTIIKNGIVFCNLTRLHLSKLRCAETPFLGPPHHACFERLEEMNISHCNLLKHLISIDAEKIISDGNNSIFPKLKVISISHCTQLEYLMPPSFTRGLLNLESLEICECSQLKYVFGQSNQDVNDLLCIQNQNELHTIKLQALKSLELRNLPNIINIFPENYYPIWPSLHSLDLAGCPQLKHMFDYLEFRQQDHTFIKDGIVFGNLTNLTFYRLNWLETLFVPQFHPSDFQNLEQMSIHSCDQLKHIIGNDAVQVSSDSDNSRSYNSIFPKLKGIYVNHCQQLKYLMPLSFAQGLLKVENLKISVCDQLKYVFGQSNHEADDLLCGQNLNELNIIKLQALKSLYFNQLPNIISIFPENYYPIWPSLDSIELTLCPQLNVIPVEKCIFGVELREKHHTITKELGAGIVACLKSLKSLSIWNNTQIESSFNLQGFSMDGHQVTAGLIELDLSGLPEMKHIWKGQKHLLTFQNLLRLTISFCGKLEVVFSIAVFRSLNLLKELLITQCEELQQIVEVDDEENKVCLPQLTTLVVEQCNRLKCLFSFTTSIELPELKFLVINEASELEQVIAFENSEIREHVQVKFPKLEHVVLTQLPNLREFYQGNDLETVTHRLVYNCPKLSLMSTDTPGKLKAMYHNSRGDDYDTIQKINNIISHLNFSEIDEVPDENLDLEVTPHLQFDPRCLDSKIQAASEEELHSPKSIRVPANQFLGAVLDQKVPLIETPTNESEFSTRLYPSHLAIPRHATSSVGNKETVEESDQEDPKSKETGIAPLSIDLEPLNEASVVEGLTIDNVTSAIPKSAISLLPGLPPQNKFEFLNLNEAASTSFNWLKEKEDHCEGLGNDKKKCHQESFDSLYELSTSTPKAPSWPIQSEDKSCHWGKFLTLSLFYGPQMIEESEVGTIEEIESRNVQKSLVIKKLEVKTSSIDLVQKDPTNKRLLIAEEQAGQPNKAVELPNRNYLNSEPLNVSISRASPSNRLHEVITSSQLSSSAEVQIPISTPSSTSLYFSNTRNAKGDIPSGFDLNMPSEEFFEVIERKIQVINTSLNDSKFTTPSFELVNEQPMSGASLMDQQEALEETGIHFQTSEETKRIEKTVKESDKDTPKIEEIGIAPLSIDLKSRNPSTGPLVLPQYSSPQVNQSMHDCEVQTNKNDDHNKSREFLTLEQEVSQIDSLNFIEGQISVSQTKNCVDEEFKDFDLVGLLQSMEEDILVAKALTDLQASLKVPLNDIARAEATSLRLENALNFLSCHSFEDDGRSYGLKAAIDSLHQHFPSILSSFKQASATIDRFTLLEEKEKTMMEELPQRKHSAVTLITKISKAEMSMAEIQQKEAILMEQISRLQVELNNNEIRKKECEAELSSLQEQKNKCAAETIEYKKEFESVKEDKFQMIEDQRKARQELFKLDNKWSTLCGQFEENHFTTRNSS